MLVWVQNAQHRLGHFTESDPNRHVRVIQSSRIWILPVSASISILLRPGGSETHPYTDTPSTCGRKSRHCALSMEIMWSGNGKVASLCKMYNVILRKDIDPHRRRTRKVWQGGWFVTERLPSEFEKKGCAHMPVSPPCEPCT